MKYFLAFDRGINKSDKERYIIIPNRLISPNLDKDNNLKKLCTFTSSFASELELKEYLGKLIPELFPNYNNKLVIVWTRKHNNTSYIKNGSVVYSNALPYFDIEALVKLLGSRVYSPDFSLLLNYYQDHSYLEKDLFNLKKAIKDNKYPYIIESSIRSFLTKALMGKYGLEYAKLYKLVMFILNNFNFNYDLDQSEPEYLEKEWLEHRARLRQINKW